MKRKNRLWLIIGTGIVITLAVVAFFMRITLVCCVLPPRPFELTGTAIVAQNQTLQEQLIETQTAAFAVTATLIPSPTRTSLPYDATLYAQRRHEEQILQTAAGPTQYAIFFATETALVATYQGTLMPTWTPIPYDASMSPTAPLLASPLPYDATLYAQRRIEEERIKTNTGPIYTAEYFYATETALVESYQGTALPTFMPSRTLTPTPTLCPYSDVICPGGNETLSPAQEVMMLMASASAPEYGQLAQTATALFVTPTPTPTPVVHDSNCAFSWAHQDLPEIAQAAQTALNAVDVTRIQVIRADAYGENCNRADGSMSYFAAMTTDFYLSATVTDLNDDEALGQIVITAYDILLNLDVALPARHGYLDIEFKKGSEVKRFRAMFSQLRTGIEAESSGAAVLEAGGGVR